MNSSFIRIALFTCILTSTTLFGLHAEIKLKYRSGENIYEIAGHDSGKPFAILNGQKKYMPPRGHWIVDATLEEIINNGIILPVYSVSRLSDKHIDTRDRLYQGEIRIGLGNIPGTSFENGNFLKDIWNKDALEDALLIFTWISQNQTADFDARNQYTIIEHLHADNSLDTVFTAGETRGLPDMVDMYPVMLIFTREGYMQRPTLSDKYIPLFDAIRLAALNPDSPFIDGSIPSNAMNIEFYEYRLIHWLTAMNHINALMSLDPSKRQLSNKTYNGHTPLIIATLAGKSEVAKFILDKGVGVNQRLDNRRESPLNFAARGGHFEIAEALVSSSAKVSPSEFRQNAPIYDALNFRQGDIVKLLAESGAKFDPKPVSAENFLIYMAALDEVDIVKYLIEKEVNLHPTAAKSTPLIEAARSASPEMIQLLIDNGVDLEKTNRNDWTALMVASMGNYPAAKLLIENGANIHFKNDKDVTALHIAIGYKQVETTDLLLSLGADPNLKNTDGSPLFWMATAIDNRIGLNQLIEAGAVCEVTPETAIPIMEYAFRYDIPEIVEITLDQCLSPDFHFYEDFPAYWVANYYGSDEIKHFLELKGINPEEIVPPLRLVNSQLVQNKIRPIRTMMPAYKLEHQDKYGEFTATVSVIIDQNGMVRFPKILKAPDEELHKPILETIKRWQFEPIVYEDKIVRTRVNIPLQFIPEPEEEEILDISLVEQKPRALVQIEPVYPRHLKRQKIEGQVILEFVIDENGNVTDVNAVDYTNIEFVQSAKQAISKWKFQPGKNDGKIVKVSARLPMSFTIN